MSTHENLSHLLIECPFLDGARQYALLLWANKPIRIVYNLFSSAFQSWPDHNIVNLVLDPTSEISCSTFKAHPSNLLENCINFAQDFIYSIDRQRRSFYGDNGGLPPTSN